MDNTFIEELLLHRFTFNPGLELTDFRTTRPSYINGCRQILSRMVTLRWNSILSKREWENYQSLHATGAGDKLQPDEPHGFT